LGVESPEPDEGNATHYAGVSGGLLWLEHNAFVATLAGNYTWKVANGKARLSLGLGLGNALGGDDGEDEDSVGLLGLAQAKLGIGPLYFQHVVLTKDVLGSKRLNTFGLRFWF